MATIYFTASSVDGFIADPRHGLDWLMDESLRRDDTHRLSYQAFLAGVGAVVMGRSTYDWVVAAQGDEQPIYELPTWVATHRDGVRAPGATPWAGDVRDLHEQMTRAAAGRHVWVIGGGELAGQFLDAGLLDELWVQYAPVTLGAGAPLLPRRAELTLLDADRNLDFIDARWRVGR